MTEAADFVLAASAVLDAEARPDADMREFLAKASDGSLRFQHCLECGYVRFPAAPICPECLSDRAEWRVDAGTGSVWSFAVYHRAFSAAFKPLVPYTVVLVELDSGPRLISNPVGVAPSAVHIGQRGVLVAVPAGEFGIPYFVPADSHE
jgi:uncharacterized protein